jgi:hypothetical protein
LAQSPISTAKNAGIGALYGAAASMLVAFVPYAVAFIKPVDEHLDFAALKYGLAINALGACIGAPWQAVLGNRLECARVYHQVIASDNTIAEAAHRPPNDHISMQLLAVSTEANASRDPQASRAF